MQIEEMLSRPRWITASDVCLILNIIQKPNSITNLQVHNNLTFLQTHFKTFACFLARLQDIKRHFFSAFFIDLSCGMFLVHSCIDSEAAAPLPGNVSGSCIWQALASYEELQPWNPDFSNHTAKSTLVRIMGRFEKSEVKIQYAPKPGKLGLVRITAGPKFAKTRVREIGVLLYYLFKIFLLF